MKNHCIICDHPADLYLKNMHDDRYGYPGHFCVLRCSGCKHVFLKSLLSPECLEDLYTNYYPRKTYDLENYKLPQDDYDFKSWMNGEKSSAFRWVPKNKRVLDIGCGWGEALGYFGARGCDAYGVEADHNVAKVAEKFGYKIHIGLFDPNVYEANFFDYVILDQVIEHLADPVQTMQEISRILKPNGVVIIATPNMKGWGARCFGRRWIHWHVPYHLHHFFLQSMRSLAEKANLVLEKHKTITNSEWLYYQWVHLILYPKMGQTSLFWSPPTKNAFGVKVLLKMLRLFHRTKINHCVTRLFDVFRLGDNQLFFLRKDGTKNLHTVART